MRILVASGTWEPQQNGVSRVASAVAHKLAARGHTVTALVPESTSPTAEDAQRALSVHRVIQRNWTPLTIRDVLETRRHARGLGPFDALLAHGSMAAVGLAYAGLSAPLVLAYHASLPRELRFTRARLPWGRLRLVAYMNAPIAWILEREAVRRSGSILVLSEFSRSLLTADHPKDAFKAQLVSGGIDADSFSPDDGAHAARARLGVDPAGPLLLTVRRAEPRMGLEQLIRAVALLARPDVSLAVVGGGILSDDLRRLSVELGLGSRVSFAGHVSEGQLRDWYRAADLFVLPTVAYEGFGMVTAEALATGTPVVATPVGATPELLAPLDRRFVAAGSDPQALADAIVTSLGFVNTQWRGRCREYALARFDWNRVIVGWEDALADAASDPARGRSSAGPS